MRPKLHDVARLTGLSLATVSRVLNGKPGVSADARRQVLEAAAELGYQEMPAGTGSGVVGIITPELANPIFPALAEAIESRLVRNGLLAMICPSTAETVNEQDYLDHFLETDAAGVVVINGRYSQVHLDYTPYEILRNKGLPVVLVNGMGRQCPLPAVSVDMVTAGANAVRHLIDLGHRRIGALIGPRRYWSAEQLLEGWRRGYAEKRIPSSGELISETLYTIEGGRAGVAKLLEAGTTAVVTGGDLMALGAIAGIRAWGKDVPAEVSVVGFDGTAISAHTDPPLTTMRQPLGRMAGSVSDLLMEQLQGRNSAGLHLFQPELVVGGTTGPVI
ncbi:MAG TPA: LacI family DNA-binding transcriptional regulator [Acidimicrobiia bacterium]|nr:LacI family DNA-binding transcriptional regulator [Acidimicrobiia bacterium]